MRGFVLALLLLPALAHGGAQVYEPIADSVRHRLSAMVADRAAPSMYFREPADGQRWLAEMDQRLERRIPDRQQRLELLRAVQYEATRARLDPQLVLGVIEVESAFRKYAVSRAGARGYMQVMPFWTRVIGDGDAARLFHMQTNLRFGCVILRHYLTIERGDLFLALGRYNGSRGRAEYPNAVFAARQQWLMPGQR